MYVPVCVRLCVGPACLCLCIKQAADVCVCVCIQQAAGIGVCLCHLRLCVCLYIYVCVGG